MRKYMAGIRGTTQSWCAQHPRTPNHNQQKNAQTVALHYRNRRPSPSILSMTWTRRRLASVKDQPDRDPNRVVSWQNRPWRSPMPSKRPSARFQPETREKRRSIRSVVASINLDEFSHGLWVIRISPARSPPSPRTLTPLPPCATSRSYKIPPFFQAFVSELPKRQLHPRLPPRESLP